MVFDAMKIKKYADANTFSIDDVNDNLNSNGFNTKINEMDDDFYMLANGLFLCYVSVENMSEIYVEHFKLKYPDADDKYNNVLMYKDDIFGIMFAS